MPIFSLTPIHYPYPVLVNRQVTAMEDYAAAVMDEYTEIDADLREKIKKASPGELVARFFPFADTPSVNTIVRYLVFTFVIEDTYSRLPFDMLSAKCERMAVFLREQILLPGDETALKQLKRCLDEAQQLKAPDWWMERFIRHNNEFVQSILTETTFYEDSKPIRYPASIPECMRYREDQVAVYPFIDYTELTVGFSLPLAIFRHPYVQRLWKLVARFIVYVNDLYSIEKDIYNEEIMNITLVILHLTSCTLEEAQVKTLALHDDDLAEFERLCAAPPDFPAYQEQLLTYIHRLQLFVQGNLSWHILSKRYTDYQ